MATNSKLQERRCSILSTYNQSRLRPEGRMEQSRSICRGVKLQYTFCLFISTTVRSLALSSSSSCCLQNFSSGEPCPRLDIITNNIARNEAAPSSTGRPCYFTSDKEWDRTMDMDMDRKRESERESRVIVPSGTIILIKYNLDTTMRKV